MGNSTKTWLFSVTQITGRFFPTESIIQFKEVLPIKITPNTGIIEYYAKKRNLKNFKVVGALEVGKSMIEDTVN